MLLGLFFGVVSSPCATPVLVVILTLVASQGEILYGIALKGSSRLQAAYEAVLKDRLTVFPVDEAESQAYADMRAALEKAGKRRRSPELRTGTSAAARSRNGRS